MQLEEQVVDLQTRFTFQEDSLQALNDIVARQQQQIDTLQEALHLHREKLLELAEMVADRAVSTQQDEKPPHY